MKLLICDDDISTVDVIEQQLGGSELGITTFLRAYNGEVAKEIIDRERPELVLCDIGMPKVNGLEVLEFVYNNKIETEFAFLTCHEDFEYAKTALRYGASNYITKPFEMEELKMALQQMMASHRRKRLGDQTRFDSVLSSVLRQLGDGFYGQDPETVNSLLRRNGLHLSAGDTFHMVVTCADMTDAIREIWSRELLMYTIGRLHDETLAQYIGSAYTLTRTDDRFLWCACYLPASLCPAEQLEQRCRQLMAMCSDHMSLHPVVLLSDPFPLFRACEIQDKMFSRMRRLRSYAGKLLRLGDTEDQPELSSSLLDAAQVHRYLKKQDAQGFREYIGSVSERLAASPNYTRQALDDLRRELIHAFTACLRDNGVNQGALFAHEAVLRLDKQSVLGAEYMCQFAQTLFETTGQILSELQDGDDIIARAESYIRAHFRENINREAVAAIAYITPNYLSKQFRSKKGMNLREYINQIRIEEAKRLLLTTNLSVSEVAGLSGYENISYFSTVFRKHTGMSPVDWRSCEAGAEVNDEDS